MIPLSTGFWYLYLIFSILCAALRAVGKRNKSEILTDTVSRFCYGKTNLFHIISILHVSVMFKKMFRRSKNNIVKIAGYKKISYILSTSYTKRCTNILKKIPLKRESIQFILETILETKKMNGEKIEGTFNAIDTETSSCRYWIT